jgi:hypothetical protein
MKSDMVLYVDQETLDSGAYVTGGNGDEVELRLYVPDGLEPEPSHLAE